MNSLITKPRNQSPVSCHVAVHQYVKLLKITLTHRFFCVFSNAANTSKSQKISHIKETVLENFKIQDH